MSNSSPAAAWPWIEHNGVWGVPKRFLHLVEVKNPDEDLPAPAPHEMHGCKCHSGDSATSDLSGRRSNTHALLDIRGR